ncbi:cytochrome d ubiquinol oxidase subunit II [Anaeromyxobacter paludicola]|uniref:Cytochrome D oxidase subunit I n=1 Tax=Anaeromyxobacter paludicola TaxID=2918171 RepID=A0ABM7X9M4_9BACT|nr:cytochrome d ubiquinol oxidase subunit II [Anaeromyxobacter paludicola]BDG08545.1 cytochrome D oxidase subunit I [Anaeromyxobacter paludicola]
MGTLFFCFLAFLLAAYVVLDGYDLGTGMLHLGLARDDAERRQLLRTIGPLWDGNEVYLVASGGTLFFAFPELYAVSFSGFYLPLMIVLWLLIVRGVSIEVRSHLLSPLWRQAFDVGFSASSGLLAFFLGVAIGNVVRGVPVGADRWFLQPLWTDFRLGKETGILDWYTVLVGTTATFVLAEQGALWIAWRTAGAVRERALALATPVWAVSAVLTVVMSGVTFLVQPHIPAGLVREPWRLLFPAAGVAALLAAPLAIRRGQEGAAFAAWSAFLALLLASVAAGLYPVLLPSSLDPRLSLTVEEVRAADGALRLGLVWWPLAIGIALAYTAYVHRRFSERVAP